MNLSQKLGKPGFPGCFLLFSTLTIIAVRKIIQWTPIALMKLITASKTGNTPKTSHAAMVKYYEGPKGWFLLKTTTIFLRILFHTHRVRITLKTTEIKSSTNLPETAAKKAKHTNGATNRLIFEAVSPPAKRTFLPRRLTDDQRRTALKNRLDSVFIWGLIWNAPRSHFILRFAICKLSRFGGRVTNF